MKTQKTKYKSEKADITTQQLITIIILVLSFALIIFFWYQFNWKGNIDKETCHTSIILRASASSEILKKEFKDAIPLKCKTEKICLTSGVLNNDCSSDSLGKTYEKISVGNKQEILDAIADNAYSWHTTLGEGKINFMPRGWVKDQRYCLITSIISFSDNARKNLEGQEISAYELFETLQNKQTPEGISYLKNIYGINNLSSFPEIEEFKKQSIDISKDYVLIAQQTTESTLNWKSMTAGGLMVVGVVLAPFSAFTSLSLVAVVGTGSFAIWKQAPNPDAFYSYQPPQLMVYEPALLNSLKCDSFETLS